MAWIDAVLRDGSSLRRYGLALGGDSESCITASLLTPIKRELEAGLFSQRVISANEKGLRRALLRLMHQIEELPLGSSSSGRPIWWPAGVSISFYCGIAYID